MRPHPSRRKIIAATPQPSDPKFPPVPGWKNGFRELAPGVFAYIQAGGPGLIAQGVSNAGLIVGDDHAMVIDSTGAPMHAKSFIAAAKQAIGGRPFRRLINTHHHGDDVNGNQRFFSPIEIFSHPYCRDEVRKAVATTPKMWRKRTATLMEQNSGSSSSHNDHRRQDGVHYGDSQQNHSFRTRAHLWRPHDPLAEYRVLFASDIAFIYVAPFANNAHVGKWLETVDRIMKMDVDTISCRAADHLRGKKELAEMGEYFRLLQREVKPRFDAGLSPGRAAAEITLGKFDNWIGPERIVMNTVRLYNEFRGVGGADYDLAATQKATEVQRHPREPRNQGIAGSTHVSESASSLAGRDCLGRCGRPAAARPECRQRARRHRGCGQSTWRPGSRSRCQEHHPERLRTVCLPVRRWPNHRRPRGA